MAETYDETTELNLARDDLLQQNEQYATSFNGATGSNNTIEAQFGGDQSTVAGGGHAFSTTIPATGASSTATATAATATTGNDDEDDAAPPLTHLLMPTSSARRGTAANTVPADDLLDSQSSADTYDDDAENIGGNTIDDPVDEADDGDNAEIDDEVDDENEDEAENPAEDVDEDDQEDGSPTAAARRRIEDGDAEIDGGNMLPIDEEVSNTFIDALVGLGPSEPIAAEGGEEANTGGVGVSHAVPIQTADSSEDDNGNGHHNVDDSDDDDDDHPSLDLSSIFPVSRIKKLFRAGWGDGSEAFPTAAGGDEGGAAHNQGADEGASTVASVSSSLSVCPMVSADAIAMISHAAALFADDLVKRSAEQTMKRGKKTITYDDIALVVNTLDRLSFLQDVIPSANPSITNTFQHQQQSNSGVAAPAANNNNTAPQSRAAGPPRSTNNNQNKTTTSSSSGAKRGRPPASALSSKSNHRAPANTTATAASAVAQPSAAAAPTTANAALDIASFFKKK